MAQLKERFYWPGQWVDIRAFCRACTTCTTRKTPIPRRRSPLGTIKAGYPMQIIAVDILGPLPESTNNNSYILVVGVCIKKLHHPWTGPSRVSKPLCEAVYQIQGPSGSKQQRVIVHFDRLKPCPKGTEFVTLKSITNRDNSRTTEPTNHVDARSRPNQFVAETVEDDEDGEASVRIARQYPQ